MQAKTLPEYAKSFEVPYKLFKYWVVNNTLTENLHLLKKLEPDHKLEIDIKKMTKRDIPLLLKLSKDLKKEKLINEMLEVIEMDGYVLLEKHEQAFLNNLKKDL